MIRRDLPPGEDSLCIGCGFCCDGTLHDYVDIDGQEDEANAANVGLKVIGKADKRIFRQPCPKFGCGVCTVYAKRPQACRIYRCELLKNVDAGQISMAEAREKIALAKQLVGAVRITVPSATTFSKRSALWRRLEKDLRNVEGEARLRSAKIILQIAALQHFLDRWFRSPKRERSQPETETPDAGQPLPP